MVLKKSSVQYSASEHERDVATNTFWSNLGQLLFSVLIFLINFISRIILSPLLPTIEAMITPPNAHNLAMAFTVPFGYVIGGGAIPTFIGIMGDAGSFALGFIVTGILITSGGVLALLLKLPDASGSTE